MILNDTYLHKIASK